MNTAAVGRVTSRRGFLSAVSAGTLAGAWSPRLAARSWPARRRGGMPLGAEDSRFLDELGRASWRFFDEAAHPDTGQVLDRRRADGGRETRRVASIAATGFGLAGLCVAERRSWISRRAAVDRARRTLRFLAERMEHHRGFFYHFHDWETGERVWRCELSSIDTALLLAGVLTCGSHFDDRRIEGWAREIADRVEWPWMLDGGRTFSMGWFPEKGFLESRWDHYCELMILYFLALGSRAHPVPVEVWRSWDRPVRDYYGERFVWSPAPLFVHQFSHAWVDFRGRPDDGIDWHANSVAATRAHLAWSLDRRARFPRWSEDLWGVTSSDSEEGYVGWGGPPDSGPLDGTIVPCAAAGSLPFLPDACLRTLRHQRREFGARIWGRYGFVDAYNPHNGWVNPDVIGIDVGITLLMAENLRSGLVWEVFGRDPGLRRAWKRLRSVRVEE